MYGVDWEALGEDGISISHSGDDPEAGGGSWVRRTGPPERLSDVVVDEPHVPLPTGAIDLLFASI